MKRTVLVCDRPCVPEEHRATRVVWIRTAGSGRAMRQDVCERALAVILGTSANGATAPAAPGPVPERRPAAALRPGTGAAKTAVKIRAHMAQHSPATFEHITRALTASGTRELKNVGRVLRELVHVGELTRGAMGIYHWPGAPRPTPPADEIAAARAVLRLVEGEPGIRASHLGGLLGYQDSYPLKRLLAKLVEDGRLKKKGRKSATRYFPGPAKD
jgi:hypothetical protein